MKPTPQTRHPSTPTDSLNTLSDRPLYKTFQPTLDAQQGAFLSHCFTKALRVTDTRLRCLDVVNCPQLTDLDLSACQSEFHLTVQSSPALRRIHLPAAGQAIVHIDFGEKLQPLIINGAIERVDACWFHGSFASQNRDLVLNGVQVTPVLENAGPHELQVVYGDQQPRAFIGEESHMRELLALDCQWHSVKSQATQLRTMQLHALPQLTDLTQSMRLGRVNITQAPQLKHLALSGHTLLLADGCANETLTIKGHWRFFRLSHSTLTRLHSPDTTELSLHQCSKLAEAALDRVVNVNVEGPTCLSGLGLHRLKLDVTAIRDLTRRACEQDFSARQFLWVWCGEADDKASRLAALEAMAEVCQDERDLASLWNLRCRLHVRSNRRFTDDTDPLSHAKHHWNWSLPHDLEQLGWDADLQIWLACRELPEAQECQSLFARTHRPRHLVTLARWLITHPKQAKNSCIHRCLHDALVGYRGPRPLKKQGVFSNNQRRSYEHGEVQDLLAQVGQALVLLRDKAMAEGLVRYAYGELEAGDQVALLGRLLSLGLTSARSELMAIAASPEAAYRKVASDAMGLAMMPVEKFLFDAAD